jgi:hypothetical protein
MTPSRNLNVLWLPHLDVPSALSRLRPLLNDCRYMHVSMLDSTPRVAGLISLVPMLKTLDVSFVTVDDDVVIEWPAALALVQRPEIFAGFDEVWLCMSLASSGKPSDVRITSDTPLIGDVPAQLSAWMDSADCDVGLGDGDGLNCVTWRRSLLDRLESFDDYAVS